VDRVWEGPSFRVESLGGWSERRLSWVRARYRWLAGRVGGPGAARRASVADPPGAGVDARGASGRSGPGPGVGAQAAQARADHRREGARGQPHELLAGMLHHPAELGEDREPQ